jgi:hypothetical protein
MSLSLGKARKELSKTEKTKGGKGDRKGMIRKIRNGNTNFSSQ